MKPTINFYLKTQSDKLKKDGSAPLYMVVTLNRRSKHKSLKINIHPDKWDFTTNKPKARTPIAKSINEKMELAYTQMQNAITTLTRQGKAITLENLFNEYEQDSQTIDFLEYAKKRIDWRESIGKSKDYIKGFRSVIKNVGLYQNKIDIREINKNWLEKYHAYLHQQKLKINTIWGKLKCIRTILQDAMRDGIIKDTPFEHFQLKREKGNREFLTIAELKKLQELYRTDQSLNDTYRKVLRAFLFACFTGLRLSDIRSFTPDWVTKLGNQPALGFRIHKTREMLHIPLFDDALSYLPADLEKIEGKVFKMKANHTPVLRALMQKAGITKDISFHCARHTFATVSLTIGIDIETVQKILGHAELRETLIYARIVDAKKIAQMQKWNELKDF